MHFKQGSSVKGRIKTILCPFIGLLLLGSSLSVKAAPSKEPSYQAQSEERYEMDVQSNGIPNWPTGPQVYADAAIVMDVDTGAILYAKNIYEKEYPASTTKIMTGLIAMEECSLDEVVNFSSHACAIPWDASTIGMSPGQSLYMEQALYGMMIGSANEVATAIGEHISGSEEAFAQKMNERAKELGCRNSHFVNANGLFDEEHYTCAYDLALIAKEYFSYDLLGRMSSSYHYYIDASDMQPREIDVYSKNQLLAGKEYAYDKLVGSKTGYTDIARSTLVTCAQSGNQKLICVVLKEESPLQFSDTIALLEYGFKYFSNVDVASEEKRYSIESTDPFYTENDLFGNSKPILYLDPDRLCTVPENVAFSDLDLELSLDATDEMTIGTLHYSYQGQPLGQSAIMISGQEDSFAFHEVKEGEPIEGLPSGEEDGSGQKVIYINVKHVILVVVLIALVLIVIMYIISYLRSYEFAGKRREKRRRKKARKTYSLKRNYNRSRDTRIRHRKQKRWK